MTIKRGLNLWTPVVACMALIFWLSSIPGLHLTVGLVDFVLRKCAHVTEYALLTVLLARAQQGSFEDRSESFHLRTAVIVALLYAVSDEIHQAFVPHRGPSPVDVLIDSVGVTLAFIFWRNRPDFLRLKK